MIVERIGFERDADLARTRCARIIDLRKLEFVEPAWPHKLDGFHVASFPARLIVPSS